MIADHIHCPHCKKHIDMTDGERIHGHVSYWGEEGAKAFDCPECEVEFFIEERVSREWNVGRSPCEAEAI